MKNAIIARTSEWAPGQAVFNENFVIESVLGRGGFCDVYEAKPRYPRDGWPTRVALKVPHIWRLRQLVPGVFESPEDEAQFRYVRLFLREARQWASLPTHPHLVRLHGLSSQGEHVALIIECVSGATLEELRLASRPRGVHGIRGFWHEGVFDVRRLIGLSCQLASALECIHRHRVCHLDVSPANVLISAQGVKLADFGLASAVRNLEPGSVGGTPGYIAPELCRQGASQSADTDLSPADVFGFGLTVLSIAAGGCFWASDWRSGEWQERVRSLADDVRGRYGLRFVTNGAPAMVELLADCVQPEPRKRPSMSRVLETIAAAFPEIAGESLRSAREFKPTAPDAHLLECFKLLESGESAFAEARAMIRHSRSNGFVVANFEKDHSLLSKMVLKLHPHADLENYAGFSDQWRLLIEFLKRVPASGFCPETLSPMVVVALE